MSFVLEFLREAAAEVECVTGDYEARVVGLGVRFRFEIESTCAAIVQHPFLWRLRPAGYRRVNLPGFPYYIAFTVEEERALVIAVAHANRHPDYFRSRLP
jgi:plasmid stabilization system protein ParE